MVESPPRATAGRGRRPSGPRRGPRQATPRYLRRAALHYLDRYPASAAHLRRLLLVKVERSARAHGTDRAAGAAAIEALLGDLVRSGLLDDRRYAAERALALFRRGASARAIRADLLAKGVEPELIDPALDRLRAEAGEPELAAALAFARRRRLGPYRATQARAGNRDRDLAALGRQGFGYDLARRVIEADDAAELEAEAEAR